MSTIAHMHTNMNTSMLSYMHVWWPAMTMCPKDTATQMVAKFETQRRNPGAWRALAKKVASGGQTCVQECLQMYCAHACCDDLLNSTFAYSPIATRGYILLHPQTPNQWWPPNATLAQFVHVYALPALTKMTIVHGLQ